jgi:hypothetical protein
MRKTGFVSLWLGVSPSLETLEEYVHQKYSDDGDIIVSPFMNDFSLPSYDEDFLEVDFLEEKCRSLAELLTGFSYDETLINNFNKDFESRVEKDANSIVLIYNYLAKPKPYKPQQNQSVQLQFIGSSVYQ